MACGCNKNKGINRSGPSISPTTLRSTSGGISAGPTPTQLRAQSTPPLPQTQTNAAGLSAERRKTQAIRRDAIRKALNK